MSKRLNKSDSIHEQLNFLGYMGMGTGGIPTTDNIPETTQKLGCPTDNIPDKRFFKTPRVNKNQK